MSVTKVQFSTKQELFDGTYVLLEEYEAEFASDVVRSNIEKLRKSLIGLAKEIHGDKEHIVAHVCGSRKIGIATEDSDVDVFLDIGGTFGGRKCEDKNWQMEQVSEFKSKMEELPEEFREVDAIPKARVPIVKFVHRETDFKCDLSFRSGLSHQKSKLVKFYVNSNPKVKFVVAGVKYWMEKHELAAKDIFISYAQVWLALFFLMQKKVIPCVLKLRRMAPVQALNVEGWNCAVPKNDNKKVKSVDMCSQSAEELLADFFVFYSDTILEQSVMRPHFGSTRKRKTFNKVLRKNCEKRGEIDKLKTVQRDFRSAFKIQDPFDMLQCLTKEMSRMDYCTFAHLCRQTAALPNK